MPDAPFGYGGSTTKKTQPFGYGSGTSKTSGTFGYGAGDKQAVEVSNLEEEASTAGVPTIPQESPGLFRRTVDILSRPNYAVAGAAEEMFSPQAAQTPEGPMDRAFREFFSGVGGLKGEKRGFGEVMERGGVGTGPTLADTGVVKPGSFFDVSGRGVLGTALDIFTDPTTYLTLGVGAGTKVGGQTLGRAGMKALAKETPAALAKGAEILAQRGTALTAAESLKVAEKFADKAGRARIAAAIEAGATDYLDKGGVKWAGYTIASSPIKALAESGLGAPMVKALSKVGASPAVLAFTAQARKPLDAMGKLFVKGYGIRGLPEAEGIITDNLGKGAYMRHLMEEDIKKSPLAEYLNVRPAKRMETFKDAIDKYEVGGIEAVPEKLRPAMQYYANTVEKIYQADKAEGLIGDGVENYFSHIYLNDPEEFAKAATAFKNRGAPAAIDIGRFALDREFDTLKQAETWSKVQHGFDPSIPVLRPNYDPIDVLTRRWEASIKGRMNKGMAEDLAAKYDAKGAPFAAQQFYDATNTGVARLAPSEMQSIDKILSAASKELDKPAELAKLSTEARKEFFRQRFAKIGSRDEGQAVLNKYGEKFGQDMPKITKSFRLAEDGSPYRTFKAGGKEYELPQSLTDELYRMNDKVINTPELKTLLDGFDTLQNFWKGSVTWIFPSFHFRNAYSNVAMSFQDIGLHALNPASYQEAAKIIFGKGDGVFKTRTGLTYSYDEIRKMFVRNGVKTRAEALAEFTGRGPGKAYTPIGKGFEKARQAGTAIENESRGVLFLNHLRRGLTSDEAAGRVNKFLYDYANGLTSFERQVMRRLIPFYTFQRINMERMIRNVIEKPGIVSAQVKPFRGRDQENEMLTTWDAGALKIRLNQDGKTVRMLTGVDLPIRNLDNAWRGDLKSTAANLVGMTSPMLKIFPEIATGKSLFTQKDFTRQESYAIGKFFERMPAPMQQYMGYKKDTDAAGRPKYTFDGQRFYLWFQAWAASRIVSTSDRQFREYMNAGPEFWKMGLDIITGIRTKELNLDDEYKKKLQERERQLNEMLIRWGERKSVSIPYKPKQ